MTITLFLENSFSINNYISISSRIKQIPLYFIYFLPIDRFKNLDKHYKVLPNTKSNIVTREIKHKLLYFDATDKSIDFRDIINDFHNCKHFATSLYHIFYSCSILYDNHIAFIPTFAPFVLPAYRGIGVNDVDVDVDDVDGSHRMVNYYGLPLLHDFSNSFYFPAIHSHNLKLYFSLSLLQNPYIPIDVFMITHLIHHPVERLCDNDMEHILRLFFDGREKLEILDKNILKQHFHYFLHYNSNQIIQYLLQFKHTWSNYSICYFFIVNYPDLLDNFSLRNLFISYIHSSFKQRSNNFLQELHVVLFSSNRCLH
jgi:hypothetical protein